MMKRIAAGLLFGVLALSPGISLADGGDNSLEEVVVKMANTPEEHAALAEYYHKEAMEARANAKLHESMGRAYGGGKMSLRRQMKSHCDSLAKRYNGLADDYEALAKLQEEESKKGK